MKRLKSNRLSHLAHGSNLPVSRYHIHNETHLIEFSGTPEGLEQVRKFRRNDPRFKRRAIRDVLQMHPERVILETVIPRT